MQPQQPNQVNLDAAALMKLVSAVFYVSLALFVLLGAISVVSPSEGLAKALGFFGVIALGAFFGMLGALIQERHRWYRGQRPVARPGPGTAGFDA